MSQLSTEYSVHANVLRDWRTQALKGLPTVFERRDDVAELKAARAAAGRPLRPARSFDDPAHLAEKKAATLAYRIRRALIEPEAETRSLATQTYLLSISRTHLYYRPAAPSAREVAIKHRIDELFTECPFYGSRKLHALLLPAFGPLARNTVRHYMQEMGLAAIYPGPKLSRSHPEHRVYPYLLRNVTAAHPNHIWGVDITYVRVRGRRLYLVAILDWFSRYVISWALDDSLEIAFVLDTMDRALTLATPTIWNSDQGSHFTSPLCTERLVAKGV